MAEPTRYCTECREDRSLRDFDGDSIICDRCNLKIWGIARLKEATKAKSENAKLKQQLALAVADRMTVPEAREFWHHLFRDVGGPEKVAKMIASEVEILMRSEKRSSKLILDNLWRIVKGHMDFEKKEQESVELGDMNDDDLKREAAKFLGLTVLSPEPPRKLDHDTRAG